MDRFSNFVVESFLTESLNDPLEFYMTEDTKMPREIYSAFELDGIQYGMSLILTKYDKVYMLDFYRIVNVKKRSWSFYKPNHVRKCLSTVIKFMESCYPFLQAKMDGMIIEIPGKTGSEKYAKFLNRIIKKSYIKKYRDVPVEKTTKKARNYLFLVKKGLEPTSLFKTATFHKNFKFDNGSAIFDDKIMGQTTEPYKKVKPTVSTKPHKKYAFGAAKVELTADANTVEMLDKASELYKINKNLDNDTKKDEEYSVSLHADSVKMVISNGSGGPGFGENKSSKLITLSIPHVMAIILPNAFKKIKEVGYDTNKIIMDDLKYAASQGFSKLPKKLKDELIDAGMFQSNGQLNDAPANMETIKGSLAGFMFIEEPEIEKLKAKIEERIGDVKGTSPSNTGNDVKVYKLELEKEPVSVLESFSTANESSPYSGGIGFVESDEDVEKKKTEVLKMPEVEKWYNNFDTSSKKGPSQLHYYTGIGAGDMNNELRRLVNQKEIKWDNISSQKDNILTLMEYFKKAPKINSGIWVYRNADTPGVEKYEVGDDYIDAAFLSTSVKSSMNLSASGNLRLKIYVPKGTRCFPIFGKSEHKSEDEIVLPPMSLLRITEIYDNVKKEGHRMMVCTMLGSAFEDALELGNEGILLEQENKKKKKYNPEDKWGKPTSSYEDAANIKKLLVTKKIKAKR